jgi:hypothetical protein
MLRNAHSFEGESPSAFERWQNGWMCIPSLDTHSFLLDNNSLLGGIAGAVLTTFLLWARELFVRPKLTLRFSEDKEGYLTSSTHPENGNPSVTRKYLRVSVSANAPWGFAPAKQCVIYLSSIEILTNGKPGANLLHDARQISWPPYAQFGGRELPNGITLFANVVFMKEGELGWSFQIPNSYGLGPDITQHPGTLRLGLVATAENAKPVRCYVRASIVANHSGFEATFE